MADLVLSMVIGNLKMPVCPMRRRLNYPMLRMFFFLCCIYNMLLVDKYTWLELSWGTD
jgi:hypothetical protein